MMPLLNLEDDMYTDLAASVSSMMVRSYAVAIVKPAEGKTDAVKSALEAYVTSEQQSMEHYLEDQYQIAKPPPSPWPPPARSSWCAPRTTTPCWPTLKRRWPHKFPAILPHSVRGAVSFCPQLCYTVPVIVQFYRSNLYV